MSIKRIIFDLDNTLIDWKEEYWNTVKETFMELHLQCNDETVNRVKCAVDMYEDGIRMTYNKQLMQEAIEKELGYMLPQEFINIWLKYLGECVPEKVDESLIKTLEYLKNKYELVVLSNWFKSSQDARLKKAGLYKFFTATYMTESFPMKPNKEAFEIAKGKYKENECVMVGDNFEVDIKGAIAVGMNAIYLNKNDKSIEQNSHVMATIHNIQGLKQVI